MAIPLMRNEIGMIVRYPTNVCGGDMYGPH
jgi:hypothetical protein